eukprot:scaffold103465_cov63-Phaeocystis_antarctica.AAC.4
MAIPTVANILGIGASAPRSLQAMTSRSQARSSDSSRPSHFPCGRVQRPYRIYAAEPGAFASGCRATGCLRRQPRDSLGAEDEAAVSGSMHGFLCGHYPESATTAAEQHVKSGFSCHSSLPWSLVGLIPEALGCSTHSGGAAEPRMSQWEAAVVQLWGPAKVPHSFTLRRTARCSAASRAWCMRPRQPRGCGCCTHATPPPSPSPATTRHA